MITDLDLLPPLPDLGFNFGDLGDDARTGPDPTLLDFGSSQRLQSSFRRASTEPLGLLPDIDLGLDDVLNRSSREISIEEGRRALPPRADLGEDESGFYNGPDLDLDFGVSELAPRPLRDESIMPGLEEDMAMGGMEEEDHRLTPVQDVAASSKFGRQRQNDSPLSSIRSSAERDLEQSFRQQNLGSLEPDEETVHHAQRAKRRKVLQPDVQTELRAAEIRALQQDRSKILKPAQFLSRDPVLLALMQMQREGNFVSNILGDGMQRGLAPELRGVLPLELVRQGAERKRKRDAGLPTPPPEEDEEEPQLRLPADAQDDLNQPGAAFDFGGDTTFGADDARPTVEWDESIMPGQQSRAGTAEPLGLDSEPMLPNDADPFDETVMPILHPNDSGPVSIGTKHAVHALRERFGPDAASTSTPSKRTKASVLFQDMMPEKSTTRAEATKMFFEVLVLATKDAVKVEQEGDEIGGPLRVRGKRGLWGAWAEERMGEQAVEGAAVAA